MSMGLDLFGRGYILFVNGCYFDIKLYIECVGLNSIS